MPTTETLVQSPTLGSIDNADFLWVWDSSTSTLNKIRRDNLVGTSISGGGSINTNGAAFTIPSGGGTAAILTTATTAWTPSWTFFSGSVSYTTQVGRYIVINGVATVWGYIVVNTLSSPSGGASITLPVACVTLTNYIAAAALTTISNWSTSMTLSGYVFGTTSNENKLQFQTNATNSGGVALLGSDFAASCSLAFTVSYLV